MQDADKTIEPGSFANIVSLTFGADRQQEVLAMYPQVQSGSDAVLAYERMMSDIFFVCPLRRTVRALAGKNRQVYQGYFTRVPPGCLADRQRYGAIHTSEIVYVFGNLDAGAKIYQPFTQEDTNLSHAMVQAWLGLAQTGNPSTKQVSWPGYEPSSDRYIRWDWPAESAVGLRKRQCDYIDAFRVSKACLGGGKKPWGCAM